MERRLAAILIADVVDYSRLMGEDEVRTLAALAELRSELFEPIVLTRGGKVIKRMGDGWIVEYPNVFDAVANAIEIQTGLADHEIIKLRIGVHTGDVTFQEDDIYGDGINIAARLEALAEPGQVLISDTAHHSLDGKTAENFGGGESHELKNIARPVAVWRWPAGSATDAVSTKASEDAPLALLEKPSIAVLPFDNMSGEPEQEYFSDGISEDIITELSRSKALIVVARNSSFQFRGDTIDVRSIGQQLSVGYVLEGSVRKAGQRIRVTAQLIDAATNVHLWAEHYDGTIEDIFDLQDNISRTIVTTVTGRLDDFEAERITKRPTKNFSAYEHCLRGQKCLQRYTLNDYTQAERCFEEAIARDPTFSRAHALLAILALYEWGATQDEDYINKAFGAGQTALELDPHESRAHLALGIAHLFRDEHDKSEYHLNRASELNPNDDLIMVEIGRYHMYAGQPMEGARLVRLAMQRNPFFPNWYWNILGRCLHTAQNYDEAILAFSRISTPLFFNHVYLAACHAELGNQLEAEKHVQYVMEMNPEFTIKRFAEQLPYRNEDVLRSFLDGLRKADFPSGSG